MKASYPIYLAGEWTTTDRPVDVINPYTGTTSTQTFLASRDHL
ncbi:MAG: hypothetical protein AAB932_00915 [Patescibacteria group bacterium]